MRHEISQGRIVLADHQRGQLSPLNRARHQPPFWAVATFHIGYALWAVPGGSVDIPIPNLKSGNTCGGRPTGSR
jgi:hypothetical protein